MNQRAIATGLALLGLLMLTIACSVRTPAPPHNKAADLGGTFWQLVRFQGGDDKLLLTPDDPAKYTIAFGFDECLRPTLSREGTE